MRALPRPVRSPVCRCTLAAHAPRPLREAARSPSLSSVPGVYALFDSSRRLQYVGLSSDLAASLAAHDAALGSNDASFVAAKPLPGAKQAALRDAWRAWVDEAGGPPPRQGDAAWRAAAPTRRRSDAAAAAAPRAALDAAAWRRADTAALLEAHHSALVSLVERGFAVLDGALSPDVVAAARAEAESLSASGGLVSASQGPRRGDSLAVLRFRPSAEPSTCSDAELISLHPRADANAQIQALQRGGTPGLGAAARLLASLASAVSESLGGQSRLAFQGDAPPPSLPRFPALAPAAAMQLAVYAPGGAGYLRHFDALPQEKSAAGATDLGAADAAAGPVGERVCDRVLTAILCALRAQSCFSIFI